jgi:superkiller protein 3
LHYADFASPPDPIRASKCFQKAFELDPRETVAAERLANGFAEEQEWELVEVIARRTIEGEGGLDAGVQSAKEGDAPTNVWAWKALGVVDLVRYLGRLYAMAADWECWDLAKFKLHRRRSSFSGCPES